MGCRADEWFGKICLSLQRLLSEIRRRVKHQYLTYSTISRGPQLLAARRHPQEGPKCCCKNVRSLWLCLSWKRQKKSWEQNGSAKIKQNGLVFKDRFTPRSSYLGGNVCDWCWCDGGHAVDSSVTGSCRLGDFVHGTGRCEDMFVCLRRCKYVSQIYNMEDKLNLTDTGMELLNRPCHGSSGSNL